MTAIAYVANAESGDISVLALDGAGRELREVQRYEVGAAVMPLAASPDGRVLHASLRSEPYTALGLAIDAASGRLAEIGRAPLPASMCWISTDRSGRFLLSASYHASVVAVSPIGADGAARPAIQVIATEPHAHSIQVDPANRYAFAACLGGDGVRQFSFDAESGHLADNDPPAWRGRSRAGPRHFVFHPSLPRVYLLNELDASIDVLAFDAATGTWSPSLQQVSALPPDFVTDEPWAADIHLTPDGRFLYASERRSSTLAAFAVDGGSGRLRAVGSFATEAQPRGFAVTPDGGFVLAAGQVSHRLRRHAIDPVSGALTSMGDQAVGRNPNWVQVVELPGD